MDSAPTDAGTISAETPWRRRALIVAKFALATSLLTWLVTSGRLDLSSLRSISNGGYLIAAAAALLVSMVLQALRWLMLLALQQLEVHWFLALRLFWFGRFAGLFLPGAAGGDLAKAYALCRFLPSAKTRATSTVFLDRAFGLHSLLFIGSFAGLFLSVRGSSPHQAGPIIVTILGLLGATGGLLLLLCRGSSGLAVRFVPRRFRAPLTTSLDLYRDSPTTLAGVWFFSGICNLFAIAPYCFVAAALGIGLSLDQLLAIPLVIVALTLPLTPGGLGVGETVGSELYAIFEVSQGALIVLIVRLLVMLASLPGALGLLAPVDRNKGAAARPAG